MLLHNMHDRLMKSHGGPLVTTNGSNLSDPSLSILRDIIQARATQHDKFFSFDVVKLRYKYVLWFKYIISVQDRAFTLLLMWEAYEYARQQIPDDKWETLMSEQMEKHMNETAEGKLWQQRMNAHYERWHAWENEYRIILFESGVLAYPSAQFLLKQVELNEPERHKKLYLLRSREQNGNTPIVLQIHEHWGIPAQGIMDGRFNYTWGTLRHASLGFTQLWSFNRGSSGYWRMCGSRFVWHGTEAGDNVLSRGKHGIGLWTYGERA